jgi:hypothetical protein
MGEDRIRCRETELVQKFDDAGLAMLLANGLDHRLRLRDMGADAERLIVGEAANLL